MNKFIKWTDFKLSSSSPMNIGVVTNLYILYNDLLKKTIFDTLNWEGFETQTKKQNITAYEYSTDTLSPSLW